MQLELHNFSRKLIIKAAFIVAFFMPVFAHSVENIFENGVVDLKPPKTDVIYCITANYKGTPNNACGETPEEARLSACNGLSSLGTGHTTEDASRIYTYGAMECKYTGSSIAIWRDASVYYKSSETTSGPDQTQLSGLTISNDETIEQGQSCPNPVFPTYTMSVANPTGDGIQCADPNQINLVDTCNNTSGNTQLNIQVTAAVGCFSQPDGSICQYNAVDAGGGNQYYQMDLEGDCYSEGWPNLDDNGILGQMPPTDGTTCTQSAGLMFCSATPEEKCPAGVCEEGCGYINEDFVCISDIPDDPEPCTENCTPEPCTENCTPEPEPEPEPCTENCTPEPEPCTENCDNSGVIAGLGELLGKGTYSTTTSAVNRSIFDGLFTAEKIEVLKTETKAIEAEIKTFMKTSSEELSQLLKVTPPTSSGYQTRTTVLYGASFDFSLNRMSEYFPLLAGPVMLLCSMLALFIILGKD
ncbi:MAG: hypothetical protein MJK12_03875 [Colwellia sp.]|nr:hypothetical protein [Colwellia sp.]